MLFLVMNYDMEELGVLETESCDANGFPKHPIVELYGWWHIAAELQKRIVLDHTFGNYQCSDRR